MSLKEEFETAAENVKRLGSTPTNDELLELYSFYKQGTVGDCNTEKPNFLDWKGKAKWEAWNNCKGITIEEAMSKYITKVNSLVEAYGMKS